MAHQHLTEDDIQNILDNNSSEYGPDRLKHLETCNKCQTLLGQYKHLYKGLSAEPKYALSKNFITSVIDKVFPNPIKPFLSPPAEIALIVTTLILALTAMFIFVDFKPIVQSITRIVLPEFTYETKILQPIRDLFATFNRGFTMIPFALLALFFVAVLDRFIHKIKRHKMSL